MLISSEDVVAYDRTLLSKNVTGAEVQKMKLRDDGFLKNADIDYKLGVHVTNVDTKDKFVKLQDGQKIVSLSIK